MRDISVVVVDDSASVVPIKSPTMPAPSEAAKESNAESQSKPDSRAIQVQSRIRVPTGKKRHRGSIHQPGIVLRHVNHVRSCRLNHDRLPFVAYVLLGRGV